MSNYSRKYKTDIGILKEEYDECYVNPRSEFCDGYVTKFYTFLRRSYSPDKHDYSSFKDWMDDVVHKKLSNEVDSLLREGKEKEALKTLVDGMLKRGYICLPVWKYEHGDVLYQANITNPFSCPYDSGLAGIIYCSKNDCYKQYGKRCSKKIIETVYEMMKSEVKTYSYYANGEVFAYCLLDDDGSEGDWICGFYGPIEENGVLENFGITEYDEIVE